MRGAVSSHMTSIVVQGSILYPELNKSYQDAFEVVSSIVLYKDGISAGSPAISNGAYED